MTSNIINSDKIILNKNINLSSIFYISYILFYIIGCLIDIFTQSSFNNTYLLTQIIINSILFIILYKYHNNKTKKSEKIGFDLLYVSAILIVLFRLYTFYKLPKL